MLSGMYCQSINITCTKLVVVGDREEEKGLPDNVQLDEVVIDSDPEVGSQVKPSAKKDAKEKILSAAPQRCSCCKNLQNVMG